MDLEKFKNFLKQKFIIINYPSGCFGGFLGSVLQLSDDVLKPNNIENIFDDKGSSHKNSIKSFKNFHHLTHLNSWIDLNYQDKLKYLYDRCLIPITDDKKYIVLLICCPNYNLELSNFFDENKIITIKPNKNHYKILEELIFFKVNGKLKIINFLKKIKNYNKKIFLKKDMQKIKRIISKQSAKFFIDDISYGQKNIYEFEYFFDEITFIQMLEKLQKQLDINIDYVKSINLYREFRKANDRYIESYLTTKSHV